MVIGKQKLAVRSGGQMHAKTDRATNCQAQQALSERDEPSRGQQDFKFRRSAAKLPELRVARKKRRLKGEVMGQQASDFAR
jgi:hypothetical protein